MENEKFNGSGAEGSGETESGERSGVSEIEATSRPGEQKTAQKEAKAEPPFEVLSYNDLPETEKIKFINETIKDSLDKDFSSISFIDLRKKYPKTMQKFKDFIQSITIPELDAIEDEMLIGSLLYSPRTTMYKFLDSIEMYVLVSPLDKDKWTYSGQPTTEKPYLNRAKAEYAGWYAAWSHLENTI